LFFFALVNPTIFNCIIKKVATFLVFTLF
jgi:hypothetical protein